MKKNSVILDIFHGVRGHVDTMKPPQPEHDGITALYDELRKKLSPELWELHARFVAQLENEFADDVDFYFVEGVKLGVQLGIECTQNRPD